MATGSGFWSEERVEQLQELLNVRPRLTAAAIADRVGTTEKAISTAIARYGLCDVEREDRLQALHARQAGNALLESLRRAHGRRRYRNARQVEPACYGALPPRADPVRSGVGCMAALVAEQGEGD